MPQQHDRVACRNCRFWDARRDEDGARLGLCRRLPPTYEGWPATHPEDWCGEFAAAAPAG